MTFNLSIDGKEIFDNDYCDYSEKDFKTDLKNEIIESIASQVLYTELGYHQTNEELKGVSYQISKKADEFLEAHGQEIIKLVVDRVANKIENRKRIVELTPKASELAAVDKENEVYFEGLINKALAKKFRG